MYPKKSYDKKKVLHLNFYTVNFSQVQKELT